MARILKVASNRDSVSRFLQSYTYLLSKGVREALNHVEVIYFSSKRETT